MTTTPEPQTETDAIHTHFGLSYCNHLVLPRTFLQSMPDQWQTQFVALLDQLETAFQHVPQADRYRVEAATEHIVGEMTEAQLAEAGIEADWYGGETPPKELTEAELAEWRAQHEQDRPEYYRIGDGEEVDPNTRVLLPAPDPVPHYNRGRTHIQPAIERPAMDRIYTNHRHNERRIHVEIADNEIADLLDDLLPLDHDAFAATHRLVEILQDAHKAFTDDRRDDAAEAETSRT